MAIFATISANAEFSINFSNESLYEITISGEDMGLDTYASNQQYSFLYNPANDSIYVSKQCIGNIRSVAADLKMAKVVLMNKAKDIKKRIEDNNNSHSTSPFIDVDFYVTSMGLRRMLERNEARMSQIAHGITTLHELLRQVSQ